MMQNESVVLCGLSEQEAAERRARGLGNDAKLKTGRTYGQIVRENLLTFFNLVLFGLGGVLLLLGSPRDAFFTAAIGFVNALIATAQEVRAKIKLDRIAVLARPRAVVIRDGQEKEVDPSAVVVGDLLVAGPGDQIIVDGPLVGGRGADLDESLLTGESDPVPKKPGDLVYSGTFVLSGRVVYEAQKVGKESFANKLAQSARTFTRELTPLQREVNLAVRVLLLLVLFFGVLIIDNYIINQNLSILESVQAASVVFGLAPSSLFLMIVVTYALGAVRIVDKGALVQKSNAVESLCHVDVLCLDKTGTLTANKIRLNEVVPLSHLDEDGIRQILGAYARSVSVANRTSEAIAAVCDGALRPIHDEVPFSSARKWSALAFDDTDSKSEPAIHGTYVLGAPEMLEPALAQRGGAWQATAQEWAEKGHRVVMFAFRPELVPLSDPDDQPCLPPALISLGLLGFTDELRPDARSTLDGFRQAGIQVKIISGDNPQTVAALARQAGLGEDDAPLQVVSGFDLAAMDDSQFAQAAGEAAIFGRITPEQKQRLVQVLRDRGRYAAMTGDGVNDVLALKHAKLSIAMQSGTPATRGVADIVLLGDAFSALPEAFLEGQRIMNSMGDVLRLYLTRTQALPDPHLLPGDQHRHGIHARGRLSVHPGTELGHRHLYAVDTLARAGAVGPACACASWQCPTAARQLCDSGNHHHRPCPEPGLRLVLHDHPRYTVFPAHDDLCHDYHGPAAGGLCRAADPLFCRRRPAGRRLAADDPGPGPVCRHAHQPMGAGPERLFQPGRAAPAAGCPDHRRHHAGVDAGAAVHVEAQAVRPVPGRGAAACRQLMYLGRVQTGRGLPQQSRIVSGQCDPRTPGPGLS